MGETLYLECASGISGDMTVAALLSLGADREKLCEYLESMQLEGFRIEISNVKKQGIEAVDFSVLLAGEGHTHVDEVHADSGHTHVDEMHADSGHTHANEVHAGSGHTHVAPHVHAHPHRNLYDVYEILDRLQTTQQVKELAKKIFAVVAEAEAKVHGIGIEAVHFHEVGAVDSIVDIAAAAFCIVDLDIDQVIIPKISEGSGHVKCQHGILPVPVPAVLEIAAQSGIKLHLTDTKGEMITPTGMAIAAALRTSDRLPDEFSVKKIGIGAGKREYDKANILRAMLLG
ncbi:MAG: LarC family nickel insertion protein [Lachnospiraceae bacterium]